MISDESVLGKTFRQFRNAAGLRVREIPIGDPYIAEILQVSRRILACLDRSDPFQAALGRRVWSFRARIIFTLHPFHHPELGLLECLEKIVNDASLIPSLADSVRDLVRSTHALLERPTNPKLVRATALLDPELGDSPESRTGIVVAMALGRTFGWPKRMDGTPDLPGDPVIIDSRKALTLSVLDRIIVPGTCHYLSPQIFIDLFYQGRAREIIVLLYPGEYFSLRERLALPESSAFRGKLTKTRVLCSRDAAGVPVEGMVDSQGQHEEGVWEIAHDGQREPLPDHRAARFVLFRDARGIFVPEGAHLLIWRGDNEAEDSDLDSVPVARLSEGDWLVLRPSGTRYLLDLESAEEGFGQKMDEACDWRPALERLLLTRSAEEVAEEMQAVGASGRSLPQSLRQWADGTVYGPGHRAELAALFHVLSNYGKIAPPACMEEYVTARWNGLQQLRGIRHRAAQAVRREIYLQLSRTLGDLKAFPIGGVVALDNGVRVQLCQVAAVDEHRSWVPPARLMDLQPIQGI